MKVKSVYPRPTQVRGASLLLTLLLVTGLFLIPGYHTSTYRPFSTSSAGRTRKAHDHLHKHATKWTGYSIKAVGYVFPQFHAIPENDRFWGTNFTEWVNVKKVTENRFGLETLHPTEEIGYYNLLDYDVRKRYGKLARDSGLHGLVYHHYWFGYPVMDRVLQAMLADGQPDTPFMLSWANEPWTVRWDGAAQAEGTLLDQDYGDSTEWRRHFDWMATYFRHPKYIRSSQGKVQIVIYSPGLMGGLGKRMFAKWRRWAAEDPLIGGLDVIETLWAFDDPRERGFTDAISEFAPHSGGEFDMTSWQRNPRLGAVYHRGALVSWDNTPRHVDDGSSLSTVWVHPELWKRSLIGLLRRIKLDPNPRGEENFLFINAINEWGEGNVLEPTRQWGNGFSQALRSALDYADRALPWMDDLMRQGEELETQIIDSSERDDVCVIVRDFKGSPSWSEVWQLSHTLWSLQAQNNPRWKAVVVPVGEGTDMGAIEAQVMDTYDPRISAFDVPSYYETNNNTSADEVTDFVLENLDEISPSCAQARYMLITNASTTYEPHVFDVLASIRGTTDDIIGMNFVSRETMAVLDQRGAVSWDQRCVRYTASAISGNTGNENMSPICQPMRPEHRVLDLSAAFISQQRWRKEGLSFQRAAGELGQSVQVLTDLATRRTHPWVWGLPIEPRPSHAESMCDVIHADTYTSCTRTGHIWFDGPDVGGFDSGCYSGSGLGWKFGYEGVPLFWDYQRFKEEDPSCVRLSDWLYEDVVAGEYVLPGQETVEDDDSNEQSDLEGYYEEEDDEEYSEYYEEDWKV